MKIYYEDSMPYAAKFFAGLGDCHMFSHQSITAEQLADADVLLVRSTTKVNAELLAHTRHLKFVGTATAGTNHVDKAYLAGRGIPFKSAAGCNAVAVAEYVLSALFVMADKLGWQLQDKTVGIVGAGHVGTALQQKLSALDIAYKLCDPPLQEAGDPRSFVSMDSIMQCDVITLHVPLVTEGLHPTANMFDKTRLSQLTEQQLLINACRGEVLDNAAALVLFKEGKKLNVVLDVWENEPNINLALVPYVALGTAHIAGHTIEGKARGTEMLYQAVCDLYQLPAPKKLSDYLPVVQQSLSIKSELNAWQNFQHLVLQVYNIASDSDRFIASVDNVEQFGYIRKHYPIRREFSAIKVNTGNFAQSKAIYALGFAKN
ncbi:4-phosphoerythronate dehydrogenase [Paraglaciecola sp.]|uniref:4-phosphoerythronate dehydrogenase n=1 Tax=Paraglaciecola sp. TaxID=1920173 RepID=UPI0030F47F0A